MIYIVNDILFDIESSNFTNCFIRSLNIPNENYIFLRERKEVIDSDTLDRIFNSGEDFVIGGYSFDFINKMFKEYTYINVQYDVDKLVRFFPNVDILIDLIILKCEFISKSKNVKTINIESNNEYNLILDDVIFNQNTFVDELTYNKIQDLISNCAYQKHINCPSFVYMPYTEDEFNLPIGKLFDAYNVLRCKKLSYVEFSN